MEVRDAGPGQASFRKALGLAGLCLGLTGQVGVAGAEPAVPAEFAAYAQNNFREAQARYRAEPGNLEAAWQFGRACFDIAECATNRAGRAELAELGIAACRQTANRGANSAAVHYYLGMNLAQLARTRGLSALKLVTQMRTEFELARSLDERLDGAGPDRNLGLLYRDAPTLISIGNRSQAQRHLERAVALAPDYPENRLNLIEAYLQWGERAAARRELDRLEAGWAAARSKLTGAAWSASWADWERELRECKRKSEAGQETLSAPREKK